MAEYQYLLLYVFIGARFTVVLILLCYWFRSCGGLNSITLLVPDSQWLWCYYVNGAESNGGTIVL